MDVAIGLPSAVQNTTGAELIEWARRAEAREFSSLGTIDRIVYSNYEPLTALSAAAAVTEKIGLCTSVLLGPLRVNAALLAKQALSLNALSAGRFTLGVALGGREDDYEISQIGMKGRGDWLDDALEQIKTIWADDRVGPKGPGAPGLVIGGYVDASIKRAVAAADGWIAGGVPPEEFAQVAKKLEASWAEAGRDGSPRKMALAYFSLGERAEENARAYLTDYYAWLGAETADYIANSAAKDAETVRQYIAAFADAGCDELILFPSSSDPEQVDLLADAVAG
jgi:alkanesulfonate monooxygenase SsuD/methylene tetrahydromethanopterin reductase-like flavin-dependent oxidoreductase (luciferase family)